jgi:hypothetical protein
MGDEPESALRFQCGVSLKCGGCAMSPFVDLVCEKSAPEGRDQSCTCSMDLGSIPVRRAPGRSPPSGLVFSVLRKRIRGGGKVGNLLLVFHFSIALAAGAVEMWESRLPLARFPRGSWKEWEACSWLSTLSTAPPFPQRSGLSHRVVRQRPNKLTFAFCIRRAASVSLRASACRFSIPAVIPSFKYSVHPFKEVSFS